MTKELVSKIAAYVSKCFASDAPAYLKYHNLEHTKDVVGHCQEIATYYEVNIEDSLVLLSAAWFHDIGYLYTTPANHEEKSVEIMRSFLNKESSTDDLTEIEKMILATKQSIHPNSLSAAILCDADTYHFGTKKFFITDDAVRRETELREGRKFDDWREQTIQLLKGHQFYTSYCQERLNEGKWQNISILESQVRRTLNGSIND